MAQPQTHGSRQGRCGSPHLSDEGKTNPRGGPQVLAPGVYAASLDQMGSRSKVGTGLGVQILDFHQQITVCPKEGAGTIVDTGYRLAMGLPLRAQRRDIKIQCPLLLSLYSPSPPPALLELRAEDEASSPRSAPRDQDIQARPRDHQLRTRHEGSMCSELHAVSPAMLSGLPARFQGTLRDMRRPIRVTQFAGGGSRIQTHPALPLLPGLPSAPHPASLFPVVCFENCSWCPLQSQAPPLPSATSLPRPPWQAAQLSQCGYVVTDLSGIEDNLVMVLLTAAASPGTPIAPLMACPPA